MVAEGKGGGPKTAQGKAVVRWNATRHGISSAKPVVPGLEKQEDWESHLEGWYCPASADGSPLSHGSTS